MAPGLARRRLRTSSWFLALRIAKSSAVIAAQRARPADGRARWAAMTADDFAIRRARNQEEVRRRRLANPGAINSEKQTYMGKNRAIIRAAKNRPCADCGVHY